MAGNDGRLGAAGADAVIVVEPESRPNIIATGLVRQVPTLPKPKRTSQVSEKASTTISRIINGIRVFANTVQKLCRVVGCLGVALLVFILLSIEEI
jgi:hypothetical protein